ncbi:MAG: VWA domain-containing protein [Phycisphaerae bacterium]|jgi:Mg-chelatase subunit ChlD/uncharacterized membrane protein
MAATASLLLAQMRFETPAYLALLAVLPLLVALSIRSLAGLGPARRVAAIVARCVVVLCMILALAGAQRTRTSDALAVIFLLDRSNSIPRQYQEQAFDFIRQSEDGRGIDDLIGVVAFDGQSAVERLPGSSLFIDHVTESLDPDETDLAAALRLAMALFPPETARRVVVLSDGNENVGAALEEAEHFRAAGVPIDVVPILYEHTNEVVFEQLRAPPSAAAEETINLQMVLRSQQPVTGRIKLEQNGQWVDLDPTGPGNDYPVALNPGANRFTIPVPLRDTGAHRFRAVFQPDDPDLDTVPANNEGCAFTVVSGPGKVLILATERDLDAPNSSVAILERALAAERINYVVEAAGADPLTQVRLLDYSCVVLSNVPAGDLSEVEHGVLSIYVRDLGGGLVMIGGDDSFGAGGWLGSPVEEVMPVSFDVKNLKQLPKGALVLVMHACEVPQGNYIGQRCAVSAIKTLSSRDLVGVLAWEYRGTQLGYWSVPLQTVGDKTSVIQQVLKMQMGDMPDFDPVMRPGVDALIARTDAAVRHMIVISDFDPSRPQPDLLRKMKDHKITCSTVTIGYGGHQIDEGLANDIATTTGGRFYATDDFSKLPQIFIKESRVVQRSLIDENPFHPQLVDRLAQTVAGLSPDEIPTLGGYVVTTPKKLATVPLVRTGKDTTDPVLAHWNVGLGKTVAFTSGMWTAWGADWAGWVQFSKFWGQIVRWASRQDEAAALDVTTSVHGGRGQISVEALGADEKAVDFMRLRGVLIPPLPEGPSRGTAPPAAIPVELTQTGPGRYEGEFDAQERGSYVLNLEYVMGEGPDARRGELRTGVAVAYSPEYRELRPNLALLEALRERTAGRTLGSGQAPAAFARAALPLAEAQRSIWEDLVRWMLVLFLIDVAIRRIAVSPHEVWRKARQYLADMAGRGRSAEASAAVLTTLKGTQARRRDEQQVHPPTDAGTPPSRSARYEAPTPSGQATEDLARALGGASEQDKPVVARPTGKKPPSSEGDYTSRLLQAKRRARKDMKDEES